MDAKKDILFCKWYEQWVDTYKKGAVRDVTLDKYRLTIKWLYELIPDLKMSDINRMTYQNLLNQYAEVHEKQTVMDFHHHLKGAILDAIDEGLIDKDPTRKVVIKGKPPREKKKKYLSQYETHMLLNDLNLLKGEFDLCDCDWLIFLIAKTGLRFSEALALTPEDFDFANQTINISKTWDYKTGKGFQPTKNKSSVRKIRVDWQLATKFSDLVSGCNPKKPIFRTICYNSTVNDVLERHCKKLNIPVISIHGLRHTHASLLLHAGASVASVSRRLGHSSINTTQKVYLHIVQELENQDVDLMMRAMSGL